MTFVLVAQFVLVNVVVAVLMKHLEESNREAREDGDVDDTEPDTPPAPTVQVRCTGRAVALGLTRGLQTDRMAALSQESAGPRPDTSNVLVARKVCVSRMLSLPNDSYMFRPVTPVSVPQQRLQEVEMAAYTGGTSPGTG